MGKTELKAEELVETLTSDRNWKAFIQQIMYWSAYYGWTSRQARVHFSLAVVAEMEKQDVSISVEK